MYPGASRSSYRILPRFVRLLSLLLSFLPPTWPQDTTLQTRTHTHTHARKLDRRKITRGERKQQQQPSSSSPRTLLAHGERDLLYTLARTSQRGRKSTHHTNFSLSLALSQPACPLECIVAIAILATYSNAAYYTYICTPIARYTARCVACVGGCITLICVCTACIYEIVCRMRVDKSGS